jgi:Tfp pilus assembly major pilin PilA
MYKQKGLTMVSWMVVLSFVGIIAVSALNIIPSYLNFFSARSILNGLQTDSAIKGKTPKDIKRLISKRFGINNLHKIDVNKALTFKSQGASARGAFKVLMHYEDRGRIVGNLYFVTVFDHEVELVP